jgi:hypothetical protein
MGVVDTLSQCLLEGKEKLLFTVEFDFLSFVPNNVGPAAA